jgi:hypothetical protein
MVDFDALLRLLRRHEIEFVIVGGFAAMAHGASQLTQDVDVCCAFTPENLRRLAVALKDFHPVHRMTPQRLPLELSDENISRLKNLYLQTDLGQLDCRSEVKGVGDFAEVRRQSIEVELPAGPCRILGLDALIRAKEAMGGPKDKLTILQLKAIQERTQTH